MADGILTTFSRHEIKYIVTDEQADAFLKALGDRVVIDRYCVGGKRYRINTVYYDTPTFLYARRSKQPDSKKYKEKIRIRSYDLPKQGEDSTVFPEFKKKVNGYCFKRRIYAPLNEARALFSGEMKPERDGSAEKQIAYELSQFVRLTPVVPAAYVKYKRMAFFRRLRQRYPLHARQRDIRRLRRGYRHPQGHLPHAHTSRGAERPRDKGPLQHALLRGGGPREVRDIQRALFKIYPGVQDVYRGEDHKMTARRAEAKIKIYGSRRDRYVGDIQ